MPSELKPNVRCPECGKPLVMVFWTTRTSKSPPPFNRPYTTAEFIHSRHPKKCLSGRMTLREEKALRERLEKPYPTIALSLTVHK